MPLWLRISATEWMEWTNEPSWDINESIRLAKLVPDWGVDVLDVSSAGNNPKQRIEWHPRFQTDLASQIREAVRAAGKQLLIGAVGSITEAEMARSLVQEGASSKTSNGDSTIEVKIDDAIVAHADFVLAARQFLREPQWPLSLAQELNIPVKWPHQYHRAPKPPVKL
jgi:2,4-dienoyl-CoA reductase-like NADH-dependent reductase (Old Yellow Enzyme family)